jgi:hypothetical protein
MDAPMKYADASPVHKDRMTTKTIDQLSATTFIKAFHITTNSRSAPGVAAKAITDAPKADIWGDIIMVVDMTGPVCVFVCLSCVAIFLSAVYLQRD